MRPARPKTATAKPAAPPPKPKPEPTLEQRVAAQVARRSNSGLANFVLGFLVGSLWGKHDCD